MAMFTVMASTLSVLVAHLSCIVLGILFMLYEFDSLLVAVGSLQDYCVIAVHITIVRCCCGGGGGAGCCCCC